MLKGGQLAGNRGGIGWSGGKGPGPPSGGRGPGPPRIKTEIGHAAGKASSIYGKGSGGSNGAGGSTAGYQSQSDRLHIGRLPPYMTDDMLTELFNQYGTVAFTSVLEDAKTSQDGSVESVAIVQMSSKEEAASVLQKLDGDVPEGLMEAVVIRYAGPGARGEFSAAEESNPMMEKAIYVGNVPADMDSETFVSICGIHGKVVSARLIPAKKAGVAVFASVREAQLALDIVNGFDHAGVKLTARPADGSLPFSAPTRAWDKAGVDGAAARMDKEDDGSPAFAVRPHTGKLYVTGLPSGVEESVVQEVFAGHGEVITVRVVWNNDHGSGCVVQMANRWVAAELVRKLHGVAPPPLTKPLTVRLAESPEDFHKRAEKNKSSRPQIVGFGRAQQLNTASGRFAPYGQQQREAAPDIEVENPLDLAVEGMSETATKLDLIRLFTPFGKISGITWGTETSAFIQFVDESSAETAVEKVSGVPLADGTILDVWPRWMCGNDDVADNGLETEAAGEDEPFTEAAEPSKEEEEFDEFDFEKL